MSNENYDFSLSTECVRNLPFNKYEKNFRFIVNGKTYQTSRFVADLISPYIRKLHYSDPLLKEFVIDTSTVDKTQNNKEDQDYFDEFLTLSTFEEITIDTRRQKYFLYYFHKLGNIDEYFRFQPDYLKAMNVDNIFERLQTFAQIQNESSETRNSTTSKIFNELIDYAAEHFEELDKERMKNLSNEIISLIIQNPKIKLREEDSLLEFVLNLYEEDHSHSNLFEYVLFANVSEEKLSKFVNVFDVECINNQIFQSICKRFFKNKSEYTNEKRYSESTNFKEFKPKEDECFDGILRYLTNQTGGNIHDNGTIEISSNSICGSSYHPKNSLDYQNSDFYHSEDDSCSYVCINFKDKYVQVSSYSIQSTSSYFVHLKNWSIEVSKDGQNWIEIDRHSNDSTLNNFNAKSRFDIKKQQTEFYQFVRLLQTGESWNSNYIGFVYHELYGKLQEPKT